ncbi:MAG: hypothetical protein BWK74_03905 [Desulfobacteraceae bacterium A6]|nr:MAG: hypothetical protein BWK74_03905 [Desulfobacteraceae bacterium A6]
MKTIIIGLGNPILSDDSVGIKVARKIKERVKSQANISIDIIEAYAGGIRLMDELVGYDRAFIVDAMVTKDNTPGAIRSLSFSDLISTRNMVCAHDMNLPTAIEMGRMLGMRLPSEIRIWGIEAADVETFGEELTEDVAKAVPLAVERVMDELRNEGRQL